MMNNFLLMIIIVFYMYIGDLNGKSLFWIIPIVLLIMFNIIFIYNKKNDI